MTAMAIDSGHIKAFAVGSDPLTVGSRWKKWKRSFGYFIDARAIDSAAQKRALLLDCAGEEVQDIFDTLPEEETPENDYAKAIAALDKYFTPRTNIPYERFIFRRTGIEEGENITRYVTKLKQLAVSCEFADRDDMIRDQVIEKCKSDQLRRKLLEKGSTLTLVDVITISQTYETVTKQSGDIASGGNVMPSCADIGKVSKSSSNINNRRPGSDRQCYRCKSRNHIASSMSCPARGAKCKHCQKEGHYAGAKYCKGDVSSINNNSGNTHSTEDIDTNEDIKETGLFTIDAC